MDTPKKRIKKRKKEYGEIFRELIPEFEHLEPKTAKKKKHSEFLQ